MTSALIVSTARTPLAKSWKGSFNMTHGATLGGHAVEHAISRAGIEAAEVDDVIMGCATPEGATGANIGRQVALRAGCPVTVSGVTVNRFCSSGLQTIAMAAQFQSALLVIAGTTLGMMIADVPAVFLGQRFAARIPMRLVHGIAALIFAALGVATLAGLGEKLGI